MDKKEVERRIFEVESEIIDLKRFYLAFKISQCKECNVEVMSWKPPIIFRVLSSGESICEEHQKELDEFNRRYTSD